MRRRNLRLDSSSVAVILHLPRTMVSRWGSTEHYESSVDGQILREREWATSRRSHNSQRIIAGDSPWVSAKLLAIAAGSTINADHTESILVTQPELRIV